MTKEDKAEYIHALIKTRERYLRQLTEFGYLEAHGGNKNRTYSKSTK